MKKNIIIGITGGIGSGKSFVSKYLENLGEHVIYADEVSRQIVRPGERGNDAIRKVFGDKFFLKDNTLHRSKLAEHVFSSPDRLALLNSMLHPLISERIFSEAEKIIGRVFIEVPLLVQTGMHKQTDFVWLVIADVETRIKRVVVRDELSYSEVMRRMQSQMSDEEMIPYADEVIDNSGQDETLYQRLDILLKKPEYQR
ncbi:MAG: dephospho-CoA kinase [Christensenellales bacterium]